MKTIELIILMCLALPLFSLAQDKEATISLKFEEIDSVKTAIVNVTSEGQPAKEVEVKLFVERLGGLLPIGELTTDENGQASVEFPTDLPGDLDRTIHVVAKIEENDIFMDTQTNAIVKWGLANVKRPEAQLERSLSAGRERAPIYFMVVANLIIVGIWGTLLYVVIQLFKLKRMGTISDKNHL